MKRFKGIIALDIDGTITIEKDRLDPAVNTYLNFLIKEGWRLIFITGRTFSFAYPVLRELKGSYFFAVQNGAALYEMPQQQLIKKHSLPLSLIPKLEKIFKEEETGLLIESGKEREDVCYYKPCDFNLENLDYVKFRISISPEKWIALDSFTNLPIPEFSVGKYFATKERAEVLSKKIKRLSPLNVIVIRDPFREGYYLALINHRRASKGRILDEFRQMHGSSLPAIAAGDDLNDVEMLEKSTFKIVMRNAPKEMHALADLIAPPACEQGIIVALKEAVDGRINQD